MTTKINIDGTIGLDVLKEDIESQLKNAQEVELFINSGGGSVTEGYAIHNVLKQHKYKITVNISLAASIASVIALAGDHIKMHKNTSLFMIHLPSGVTAGTAEDHRKTADVLDKIRDQIIAIYQERTNIESGELLNMLNNETWFTAQEALDNGFIDEIISEERTTKENMIKQAIAAQSYVQFDLAAMITKIENAEEDDEDTTLENIQTLSDCEKYLRQMGISNKQSKILVSKIKEVVKEQLSAANDEEKQLLNVLREFNRTLK